MNGPISGRELLESEERYRDLVESSRDLFCTHDLDGRLLSVNEAAVRMTGYPRDALLGMNLADLLTSAGRDLFAVYPQEVREKGTASGLMRIRTAGGELAGGNITTRCAPEIWVNLSCAAWRRM